MFGDGGAFKSTDSGGSWSPINTGLTAFLVNALAIDPSAPATLYAGTDPGFDYDFTGVFKSTDGGANWRQSLYASVLALAIDPSAPATLYAGTFGGVFKSTNGGESWSAINAGLTGTRVQALVIDPSAPATLYAGTSFGVFKSTNGGASWTAINTGLTNSGVGALAIDPSAPATLYAGTDGGVFKSTNGGGNWTAMSTGLTNPYWSVLWPSILRPRRRSMPGRAWRCLQEWRRLGTGLHSTPASAIRGSVPWPSIHRRPGCTPARAAACTSTQPEPSSLAFPTRRLSA